MRKTLALAPAVLLLSVFVLFSGAAYSQSVPPPSPTATPPATDGPAKIDPRLETQLQSARPGEMVTAIITLKEQADLTGIGGDRAARQEAVIRALQAKADASQSSLRALLQTRRSQGSASQTVPFWIFNGLSVTATADVIRELAARPEVLEVTPDDIQLVPFSPPSAPPEQNLSIINAPALWSLGYQGQGVVIGVIDTGVDINHPELSGSYRGGNNSWCNPYDSGSPACPDPPPDSPYDLAGGSSGHGTATAGVLVGGELGGTAIGVAPQAQWIAAKIFRDDGQTTTTAVHTAFQWMLDPDGNPGTPDAPHVVNNSWGLVNPGCSLTFQTDVKNMRAAGILPVFAAGNVGPNPSTSVSPANYTEAFAVGNTDDLDVIAFDSSRGPSACDGTIYPEIVAPGVDIRTTESGFPYTYSDESGTSLSAPHVSGALALLLDAFPNLTPTDQAFVLMATAVDLGDPGPDNTYGSGRMDVLAAYNSLTGPVGGIAELPDLARRPMATAGRSTATSAALAAGLATMVIAAAAGAWYAKRLRAR